MLYRPIIHDSIAQLIRMVIDHEVYLSYKKDYCYNAKALSLIQLNMADLSQCC